MLTDLTAPHRTAIVLAVLGLLLFVLKGDIVSCVVAVSTIVLLGLVFFLERARSDEVQSLQKKMIELEDRMSSVSLNLGLRR